MSTVEAMTRGPSNRDIDYRCANCGRQFRREDLRAKRVYFMSVGAPLKTYRSRTVAWLCVPCMEADPDYDRVRLFDSPGLANLKGDDE